MDTPGKVGMESLPLPELDLPKSWWNEEEVSYFFSPFRSHNQNPADKDNKIKFWRPLILKWCDHNRKCTVTLSELERTFTKNQLIPACLPGVVDDMLRKNQLCAKDEFLLLPSQTWSGWAVDLLIKKPVGWSFRKAKELIIKTDEEKTYVVIEAAKLQANILLGKVQEICKGTLIAKSEIEKIASDLVDLEIILHWLHCRNKIACADYKGDQIIKFCDDEKTNIINETDIGIFALQQTENKLNRHLEKLEEERLATIQSAKSYVAKGMKQMAKNCLRKKHSLEKTMEKHASVLENVQSLLARIRESHSDSKILETYEQGLAALKFTLKEANLNDDNVSNTMLELNEMFDIHNEIQESISKTLESSSDQELEDELEKLLLSENRSVSSRSVNSINLKDLPNVPMENLSESPRKKEAVCL